MAAETPSTPTSPAPAKRNMVPVIIVVGVIVLVIIGVGIWALASDDDSSGSSSNGDEQPTQESKNLYDAWQSQDRAAAGKVASPEAVTSIFAFPIAEGTGLVFGSCEKDGAAVSPQTCTFSRPGGALRMSASESGDAWTITAVTLGPAATTPTS